MRLIGLVDADWQRFAQLAQRSELTQAAYLRSLLVGYPVIGRPTFVIYPRVPSQVRWRGPMARNLVVRVSDHIYQQVEAGRGDLSRDRYIHFLVCAALRAGYYQEPRTGLARLLRL